VNGGDGGRSTTGVTTGDSLAVRRSIGRLKARALCESVCPSSSSKHGPYLSPVSESGGAIVVDRPDVVADDPADIDGRKCPGFGG